MKHTQTHSKWLERSNPQFLPGNLSTSLVPRAKVQDMLLEIAFVLHATRRIAREVAASDSCPSAGCVERVRDRTFGVRSHLCV